MTAIKITKMKSSSRGTILTTVNHFGGANSSSVCREYIVSSSGKFIYYKAAIIIILCSCLVYQGVVVSRSHGYTICLLFIILGSSLLIYLSGTVHKETLLLVVPLTLQMTTTYIFGNKSTSSVPWSSIGDFMIMEVIMHQKVDYFLSFILIEEDKKKDHIILFKEVKPPRDCLEIVYRDVQKILDGIR